MASFMKRTSPRSLTHITPSGRASRASTIERRDTEVLLSCRSNASVAATRAA